MIFKEVLSVTIILFSVIDILGNIPVVISLKKQGKKIEPLKATAAAGVLMILFLLVGESILHLFGVDVESFAIAGAIILFILGLEMILGVSLFKDDSDEDSSGSVFPLAFPMIAGAGTLTTILSLKAEYESVNIFVGIAINLIIILFMLRISDWLQRKLGKRGEALLRKIFGIVLLAIAIKLFRTNLGI